MPKPAPAQAGGSGGPPPRLSSVVVAGQMGPGPPCMFALTREPLVSESNRGAADRCPLRHTRLPVIPAEAGIHAICGVKGTPNVRRRPITCGAPGALAGRRADGGSSHGWALAWIPASAGMTEGAQEWRKDGNGARMGMTERWEWRKSLRWSSVRTSESMLTARPLHLAPCSPDVSRGRLPEPCVRPLTACMRRLLVILNAMLKHHTPWRDLSPHSAH